MGTPSGGLRVRTLAERCLCSITPHSFVVDGQGYGKVGSVYPVEVELNTLLDIEVFLHVSY